ncbi:MaoC family dehydratase [Pseudohoeflea coraliihabitans]|uniref:MaoC family dehydratase n=1 Tax=Pseudohoeflea coraliihabitans TaxID=2860393 RepID=A0ABS6WJ54_9HYPH|nr:MaoC family dehydratase [Pseudohoeflea sp. DP4N28-3]MBW3095977.1 MaoC family dehydratase [Pseudohoeflea sp. DP4N28-3]
MKTEGDDEMAVQPTITIDQAMIDAYAAISGDFNPVHVDPDFAATTPFGTTIAHGCIPMEPIFRLVQSRTGQPAMPPNSRMKLRYLRPAHPGDTIGIEVTATLETGFEFRCINQRDETVIEGNVQLAD